MKGRLLNALFTVFGLLALVWFLVRCIPKPSRATYPCQRAAFPLAAAFVTYLAGLWGMAYALRKARRRLAEARYLLAGVCIVAAGACFWATTHLTSPTAMSAPFVPADPPNTPLGTAGGIFPGRVTWAYDLDATNWDAAWDARTDIHYWDDDHTSQTAVEELLRRTVLWLTEEGSEAAAWDALFKDFNDRRGLGAVGYTPGESVVIKPNHVEQRLHDDVDQRADASPQVLVALLKQLVNEAGVRQQDITVCDASRYIANKTYDRCHALFPDVIYAETNYYADGGQSPGSAAGRVMVTSSTTPLIHYSGVNVDGQPIPSDHLPQPFVDAAYVINLAIMKGHSSAGATLCAKNWYGSFCESPEGAQHDTLPGFDLDPAATARQYGQYRTLVDLMGHEQLGGKTLLYILDGLWGFPFHGTGSLPLKWQSAPFGGDYPSSVLMSQDPVAIDSVGVDFLRAEFADNMGGKGRIGDAAVDDYLHEAALAHDAPSSTVYDPENDGSPLGSLGVHEHWNNATDKQYTRNLGTGDGIELLDAAALPPPAEQRIPLNEGLLDWCSFNVNLLSPNAADVFGGLSNLAIVQSQSGGVYIPPNIVFPGHPGSDTIGPLNSHEGYQLFMRGAEPRLLTVTGSPRVDPTAVCVNLPPSQLHWIPCPYQAPVPIASAFNAATAPDLWPHLVIVQSETGGVLIPPNIVFPGHPGSNTIGDMLPGEGYKLFHSSSSAISFCYPAAPASPAPPPESNAADSARHFTPLAATHKTQPIFFSRASVGGASLRPGDELGVFDGERCVGAIVIDALPSVEPLVAQLASEFPGGALAGGHEGQPMRFVAWDSSRDAEYEMNVAEILSAWQSLLFQEAAVLAVGLQSAGEQRPTAVQGKNNWSRYE